jgi:signal transduction histidine kinase
LNHAQVVFRNILDNALKYTPAGGTVTVSMQQQEQYIHVTVTDTGRGIAADALPHIGKRFYRTDKARSRQIQGTGLGLSLVESIVQLYGGRIDISSAGMDEGTAVTVDWPIA